MTTIVNTPPSGGSGFLVGVILLIIFSCALLYFGVPVVKNMGPIQLNIPAPQINVPAPEIVMPDKVEVTN